MSYLYNFVFVDVVNINASLGIMHSIFVPFPIFPFNTILIDMLLATPANKLLWPNVPWD